MINPNIEATANELTEPLNLLAILGDEIQELYSSVISIQTSETERERQQAQNLLIYDIEQRISKMETLSSVSTELLTARQNELLDASEPKPKAE